MPELPEVETTVAGLRQVLDGAQLTLVEPRRADLRFPFPVDLRQRLTGARITGLGRRAKYGLIDTDRGDTMIFHLGMSGRWRIDPSEVGKHDHLLLETASHRLALNDPRRFGFVHLTPTDALGAYPPFVALGPEPLGDALTADYLARALEGRAAPIKAMLLDQRIIAGLGNIYVCEALNIARISPTRAAGRISRARLARLVEAIRAVLAAAIAAGGSTLRDYARPDGELGYFAKDWRVYGREGLACPCGGTVKRRVDSGRSTFYCPTCQS
ncbi:MULTISPECIES: bifunctional DNA-formamidopyrimidine glycosylase/DNA-(apurinic or apyrimidinic site) lyase [unclassified Sphingobium]|uniref:bifunctional DNA-formamidopyrimidine glycosylase/DNA-(apurinic or apyrimidinic site) lyase n=1 Tax=unclassified Sphingobium TaxID=2611147 RepID=UPI0022243421|nr:MULTISPECIES: bifunctional DNA-formamidopyrimidine glycosylase/DNA-(apurinic or apyrimidinic site) lyase [unclassified Sphingobium]MCW2351486.1 formamidopyrimidine-DNA glycosylase [Sphingobium sp. B12D2B]MCW2370708.1 formamidopyrimidine-DNA glycosylase [Sphingobium sp. B11D3D]